MKNRDASRIWKIVAILTVLSLVAFWIICYLSRNQQGKNTTVDSAGIVFIICGLVLGLLSVLMHIPQASMPDRLTDLFLDLENLNQINRL